MKAMVIGDRNSGNIGSRDIRRREGKGEVLRKSECSNRVDRRFVPGKYF